MVERPLVQTSDPHLDALGLQGVGLLQLTQVVVLNTPNKHVRFSTRITQNSRHFIKLLYWEYDDADEDGDDGSGTQSSGDDSLHVHTVAMVITLADLDSQLRRTSDGRLASSKTKGPAFGVRSGSLAVMLMAFGSGFSHISTSGGNTPAAPGELLYGGCSTLTRKRSGSWAVKEVSRDPAGRPSSSLMDLGLGLNSGLSLTSRIRTETVAVDCRGRWTPRASGTSFSASTVSMKERVSSKSMGWTEEGRHRIIGARSLDAQINLLTVFRPSLVVWSVGMEKRPVGSPAMMRYTALQAEVCGWSLSVTVRFATMTFTLFSCTSPKN
ncbi:hypothetical protein EYF80_012259 [Liparis tanakae]|uniref:Uncharacterized protein n=1 Tax=Liparis tanakae TaxID=230148 RepID=A0A4Z2IIB6_9TELE|nr:hypothetical protein EYF80_012259 [Liparis tanakae]